MSDSQIQLSDYVLDFLSDFEAVRFAQEFVKTYGLTEADVPRVMGLAEDVVYGTVQASTLPQEMISRFSFNESKAKQAAIELAKARLFPIQEVVPGIALQINAWGGEVAATSGEVMSPAVFVATTFQDVIKEVPGFLQNRLEHILELYVSKHSDRALVLDMLTRSEKVGGVEFEQADAEELLNYVDEKMVGKNIQEEAVKQSSSQVVEQEQRTEIVPPKPNVVPELKPVIVQQPKLMTQEKKSEPIKNDVTLNEQEDLREVQHVAQQKQAALAAPVHAPASVEEMVGQICSLEPMQLPDGTLADRCKQIVESRLREVRNAADTQRQIERPIDAGGLGISGRKLADMMQVIEQGFDQIVKHATEKIAGERTEYLEKKQAAQLQKTALSEKEEVLMTKRYVELTGKKPEEHISPAAPSIARVSGATAIETQLNQKEQQIDTNKVRSVIEGTKKDIALTPAIPQSRPAVSDVKFVKRLSGPIDELRALSLIDFRRMAKNPEQAAERIMSLVQLVEDQGYEKRVEAVRAWQSSPLYQQYLMIARSAMQEGKPLEQMRSEMEKMSETLTKEEMAAVLKLNGELRF